MPNVKILSLDLETTGLDLGKHVPISIGAVNLDNNEDFYCQLNYDELVINQLAMRINKLDVINPPKDSLSVENGLYKFNKWLVRQYGHVVIRNDVEIRCLGKQVGSFDLPMLKFIWYKYDLGIWPFSHRSVDLQTIFLFLGQDFTQEAWQLFEKENPNKISELGGKENAEHHALGDAWWGLFAWKRCLQEINK